MRRPIPSRAPAAVGLLLGALTVALVFAPLPADPHVRSLSYSTWELSPDGAKVEVRLTDLDASALPADASARTHGAGDPLGTYLVEHLRLSSKGRACEPSAVPSPARLSSDGWRTYSFSLRCPPGDERTIASDLFLPENPAHLHFARVRLPDGSLTEKVLAEGSLTWSLPIPLASQGSRSDGNETSALGHFVLGVEHAARGWDHLAFLFALLLFARGVVDGASVVTAFAVAQSLALGIAALGVLRPDTGAVGAAIGFSVALIGAENVWLIDGRGRAVPTAIGVAIGASALAALLRPAALAPSALLGLGLFALCRFGLLDRARRPRSLRVAIAFAFGLVHGFGLTAPLAALDLPSDRLAAALLGYNVGVAIGQLGWVVLLAATLYATTRWRGRRSTRTIVEIGSTAIFATGVFWFVRRAFG